MPEADVCANYHGGNPMSVAAHMAVLPVATKDRHNILNFVKAHPDVICEDIENALGLKHQTASARVTELVRDGRLVRPGAKKKTSTGTQASVLRYVQ